MSGYVLVSKDLPGEPKVRRAMKAAIELAARINNADVTHSVTQAFHTQLASTLVLGGLLQLWIYADTHIREDNTLDLGKDEIDELVGIAGFCDILPADYLQVIDSNHVELPDYLGHNGTAARKKALAAKRQERFRAKQDHTDSNARVTPSVTPALPSHPIPSHPYPTQTSKNPTARKAAPSEPEWFIEFRSIYPPRAGDQNWRGALKASHARCAEGTTTAEMLAGARRYAQFISATGKANTEYVKQASTFLGPGKSFLNPWTPPAEKETPMDEIRRLNGGRDERRIFEQDESNPAAVVTSGRAIRR